MSTTENNYQETDLGNVSLNPRGEYDPGASYEYLDTVSYQGGSYTCLAELGTTITGIAPDPGRNTDAWQMLTLPGDLKPEYITMHDDTVNHARQAESSRLAAELAQQAAEDAQADIQQLHTDTRQAATEAGQSRDSAAGYAQSADASRKAAAESEQNINAQVTGFDTKVSESVTQAQEEIATTRQQAIRAVASQQVTSTQAVKDQTASYIAEKETSAKTEIGNYTSEKITEINNKASEANTTLANTIADGTTLKTQLETTISTADTSKKNLDASNTAAGKTKTALDTSNTTATKTKANLDASNTTASETKTGLDATNKTAADLVASLGDKITEGTQVKTDIQTTGETAMSNLQAEATKQQEYIKTSIDDTLSISGKAADAAVTGKKIDSLKEDLSNKITKFYASSQGETHLADSDNGKIMDMMLYGRSEQKQYSGKNLINSDEYYSKYKQSDGTYKGTANDFNSILVPINKYIGTQITVSCKVTVPPNTTFVLIEATINETVTKGSRIESGKSGVIAVTISPRTESDTIKITYGDGGDGIVVASEFQIEKGSEPTTYEPYTGGIPSPNPDYPQEIKSVANPTVKVTNEDGLKVQSVTLNNITLNAIPVSSGGNVTIDGKQYIADYVDVERGKYVQMIQTDKVQSNITWNIQKQQKGYSLGYTGLYKNGIPTNKPGMEKTWKSNVGDSSGAWSNAFSFGRSDVFWIVPYKNDGNITSNDINAWLVEHPMDIMYPLVEPIETDLTPEENEAFKALVTNYPVTNISVTSDQLEGYTVFNYPISMANGWNYVKQQLNDNRDYIYDMDLQSAEAYVNSEYAVALTELEV